MCEARRGESIALVGPSGRKWHPVREGRSYMIHDRAALANVAATDRIDIVTDAGEVYSWGSAHAPLGYEVNAHTGRGRLLSTHW